VDFITTHQYDCSPNDLYGAVTNFQQFGKPVWVTEFSCKTDDTTENFVAFADTLLPLFDSDTQIERYSWFGCRGNDAYDLFDSTQNALTPLGVTYSGGPAPTVSPTASPTLSPISSNSQQLLHSNILLWFAVLCVLIAVLVV